MFNFDINTNLFPRPGGFSAARHPDITAIARALDSSGIAVRFHFSNRLAPPKMEMKVTIVEKAKRRLMFGPYHPPVVRRDGTLTCECRGKSKIGGITNAPIPWPKKFGSKSLILCGDLCRAIREESECAVAYHWDVSEVTVRRWRRVLGVDQYTRGTQALKQARSRENATPERMRALVNAARAHGRKPKSESWRMRMSVITRLRIQR